MTKYKITMVVKDKIQESDLAFKSKESAIANAREIKAFYNPTKIYLDKIDVTENGESLGSNCIVIYDEEGWKNLND